MSRLARADNARNPRHHHSPPSRECIFRWAMPRACSLRFVESPHRSNTCPRYPAYRVCENKSADRNSDQPQAARLSGESACNKFRCHRRSKRRCHPPLDIGRVQLCLATLFPSPSRRNEAYHLHCRLWKATRRHISHPRMAQTNRSRSCLWHPARSGQVRPFPT